MIGHLPCARQRGYSDEQSVARRIWGTQAIKQVMAIVYVKW